MRYFFAIGGVFAVAVAATSIWFILPRGDPPLMAQDQPAPVVDTPAPEDVGEGSFRVCNETANRVSIAFGYRADKGWQSEGWWLAEPANCVTVYRGNLETRRYYYLYAADDVGGGAWDGSVYMCTRDETFTIFGVEDCLARGYERTGFFEVDTQNRSDWTLQLTEGDLVTGDGAPEDASLEDDMPTDGVDTLADDEFIDEGTDTQ